MAFPVTSVLVLLLFVVSGAAALIYEIVWQQLLQLAIGSSTVSVAVLLGTFMGGMCLGSLYAPRLTSDRRHPLRLYAVLEIGIGVMALLLLAGMPFASSLYAAWGGGGLWGVAARALLAAVCLVPPTFAMGATLPVIAPWVERTPRGLAWLGYFYAANIVGGVAGALIAGFYLLRVFDMNVATYVAVALNAMVAAVAWLLARESPIRLKPDPRTETIRLKPDPTIEISGPTKDGQRTNTDRNAVLVSIALSGFCALSAEVVWTRMLGLIFGATVYTFSIVLPVFLIGLGFGGGAGAALAGRVSRPRLVLAWCQLLTVPAVAWSAYTLAVTLSHLGIAASLSANPWATFRIDILRAGWAILPGPILWGASFPLAIAAADGRSDGRARVVARLYAANTLGAIAGALASSLILIVSIGSQHTQQAMMAAAIMSALVLSLRHSTFPTKVLAITASVGAALVMFTVPTLPASLVAYGRYAAAWAQQLGEVLYVGEGMHASVAVTRGSDGVLNYHNAGKVQASSQPADMRLQRMLGHLTTLVPSAPRSVLVIGCGAGVTAGAVSINPNVDRVTIVEIEPLVPRVAGAFFGEVNHNVLTNPKVHVVVDDARHFLMTTKETFDAITSDPLDPWVKGAAALYTKEFFEAARNHLNPGGVMTLFVQFYSSGPAAVKSEMATFFDRFPDGMMFGNTFDGKAIDSVLVGQVEPSEIDLDALNALLGSPPFATVARSMGQIGMYGALDLFASYAGRARDLKPWLRGAEITHDRDLRLQYLAGMDINRHLGDEIYHDILKYRAFPDDVFVGSPDTVWRLRQLIESPRE